MSSTRKYTVQEIDDLREMVAARLSTVNYFIGQTSACMNIAKCGDIEQQVRTHMMAGHTAADILTAWPENQRNMFYHPPYRFTDNKQADEVKETANA